MSQSLLLAGATSAIALLLQQHAVHHLDMHQVVRSFADPTGRGHYAHFGFQWFAAWIHWTVEGTGISLFAALRTACSIGLGVATFFGHRACLTAGLDRGAAAAAALGAAMVPGVLFFATTAEIHGVFLPFAYLAWWAVARAGHRPTAAAWGAAGAATAWAAALHTTGHLLVAWCLLIGWQLRPRVAWRHLASLAVAHGVATLLLRGIDVATLGRADDRATVSQLGDTLARWDGLGSLPLVAWDEWLVPFAPFGVLFLTGIVRRPLRPWVALFAVAAATYLAVSQALLLGLVEHGAYALPLALPAAAIAAAALPRAAMWTAVVAAALLGAWSVRDQDPIRIPDPALAAGIATARAAHPEDTLFLMGWREIDSALLTAQPVWHFVPNEPRFAPFARPDPNPGAALELFDRLVADAERRGGALFLSDGCRDYFTQTPHLAATAAAIVENYALTPRTYGAFAGVAVRHRQ